MLTSSHLMANPLSITTSILTLVVVTLRVSMMAIGMVEKTTGVHKAAHDTSITHYKTSAKGHLICKQYSTFSYQIQGIRW